MKQRVYCTTRFEGFHCWPQAPKEVAFLRDPHRHEFHVRVEVGVDHLDRDVEFILLKREVDRILGRLRNSPEAEHWSCEHYAASLWANLRALGYAPVRIDVSEDGENGAVLEA
jgi:6-pyruvoyl-tetrahydropterin synthase